MIDHQSEVTKARQIRHLTPLSPTPVQQWRIAIRRLNTIRNWRPLAANRCLFTAITHPPILSLPSTSCCLDPPPTSLLKKILSTLLIPLTSIVNLSFLPGCFPSAWKHALISPLLKKPSLDQNLLAHYRSIAFLPFGSKLIERAATLPVERASLDAHCFISIPVCLPGWPLHRDAPPLGYQRPSPGCRRR